MRDRIDRLGVSEPEIRKQGSDQIVIQLAGVTDPEQAAKLIGKTAQLQFYDLEADIAAPSKSANGQVQPLSSLYALLAPVQSQVNDKSLALVPVQEQAEGRRARRPRRPQLLKRAGGEEAARRGRRSCPKGYKVFGVPSDRDRDHLRPARHGLPRRRRADAARPSTSSTSTRRAASRSPR